MDVLKKIDRKGCVEIMTGAVVPPQYDCVIPVEDVQRIGNKVIVHKKPHYRSGYSIRKKGSDHKKNSLLLKKGSVLTPSNIAILSGVGRTKLLASPLLKAAIVSTGDEIVDAGKKVKPFQIRESNAYFIEAALKRSGLCEAKRFHCADKKSVLHKSLKNILKDFDVIILSGGVSMGKFDLVPDVLKELGVKIVFHKVSQKPGKPMWFGVTKDRKPVFALPGNPVSTQVGTYRYALKHLRGALGVKDGMVKGILAKSVKKPALTLFVPVRIDASSGTIKAYPVSTGGSGDFASMAGTDGFMELPAERSSVAAGFCGEIYLWGAL
jgi:molybdopterin molybdotransferase